MSCARGDSAELVARQTTDAPLIQHMRAHAAIERDRRLVPVEHRPLHAATVPALGDRCNVANNCLPTPLPRHRGRRTDPRGTGPAGREMSRSCGRTARSRRERRRCRRARLPPPAADQRASDADPASVANTSWVSCSYSASALIIPRITGTSATCAGTIRMLSIAHIPTGESGLTNTVRPPTMVAATPPRSSQPSKGVFFDRDRSFAASTRTADPAPGS